MNGALIARLVERTELGDIGEGSEWKTVLRFPLPRTHLQLSTRVRELRMISEKEAVATLLPIDLLIRLDMWIESMEKPICRAEALRALVVAGLHLMEDKASER
jgi:hypothetical protein